MLHNRKEALVSRGIRIGMPLFLIVIGLIAAFAIADRFEGVDLQLIGYIVAGAGALWLLLELIMGASPRTSVTRESTSYQAPQAPAAPPAAPGGEGYVEREVRHEGP